MSLALIEIEAEDGLSDGWTKFSFHVLGLVLDLPIDDTEYQIDWFGWATMSFLINRGQTRATHSMQYNRKSRGVLMRQHHSPATTPDHVEPEHTQVTAPSPLGRFRRDVQMIKARSWRICTAFIWLTRLVLPTGLPNRPVEIKLKDCKAEIYVSIPACRCHHCVSVTARHASKEQKVIINGLLQRRLKRKK